MKKEKINHLLLNSGEDIEVIEQKHPKILIKKARRSITDLIAQAKKNNVEIDVIAITQDKLDQLSKEMPYYLAGKGKILAVLGELLGVIIRVKK